VRLSGWLWALSLVAGVVAVAVAVLDRTGLREGLASAARTEDPEVIEPMIQNGVTLVMAGVALLCAGLLFATFCCLRLVVRRSSAARWVLLGTAAITLFAVDLAQGMVGNGATTLDRLAFLTQGGLIVPAALALLAPSSRAWLRGAHA
jgi:uncharacterized membrane protein